MAIFFKQIISFFTSIALVVANFLGISSLPFIEKVDDFKVTTYIRGEYVQSEGSLYPEDFDIVTDVILFECASFNSKGEVIFNEPIFETALANIRKAIGDRDISISLNLLGPWGKTDSDVWEEQMETQSDEHNKAFTSGVLEDNIIAVLDKYDFDGVHFDYEYPISDNAWKYYNNFLVSLDKKLGDYTLGVAGNYWNINFTRAALNAIDTFELMIYDMVDEQGRHATYEDTVEAVQRLGLQGMPSEKVNIGLPFYSRPTDMSAYWYGYNGCYEEMTDDGWYHCVVTDKDFWFNTPEVIEKKTEYAINTGFGGVMIWHYNCDLPSTHEDSLLNAVGKAIENNY
ncbi:MAG: glycoside hydrolase family 18 protein [Clostridia bacterium]|nr:glycoside hydrolase family 18 protein [Clostridia bacterium]